MMTDDTIVAISTAAGVAARGIVRLSGDEAISLADLLFHPDPGDGALRSLPGFRVSGGRLRLNESGIEAPCQAYVFRAPRSYTRQDVVELHFPGCPPVATAVVEELIVAGARPAGAGEFTARAFLSGRIDLSAAEAVADVVHAADDGELRSAMAAVGGKVYRLCEEAVGDLADILAGAEAAIDLADEPIDVDDPRALSSRLTLLAGRLRDLAGQAVDMPDTAQRVSVAITGRPNVGKSSLLNGLSGTDRAIVSALAGTTRDVLSATMAPPGMETVTLLDAAGYAPADDALAATVNSAARRAVAQADAVLVVVDAAAEDTQPDLELLGEVRRTNPRAPWLLVANKVDLLGDHCRPVLRRLEQEAGRATGQPAARAAATSCLRHTGLRRLADRLGRLLHLAAHRSGSALGLHRRQKRCLIAAAAAADNAVALWTSAAHVADVAELAAIELRAALSELGQISGQVVTEDVLGRIFARFCVGK